MKEARFPTGFVWGTATASYQIEGSPLADGAAPSIWHTYSHIPGKVRNGDTGDVACDHYNRWRDDVKLMAGLGLKGYRFSASWSRVVTDAKGTVNRKGLDFYRGLADALVESGIEPFLTLYHWDLPQWAQDEGGWPARDVAKRYADYAETLFRSLGDRVRHWITLNEPAVMAFKGYAGGGNAPGHADPREGFAAVHHQLLGHGLAVKRFREICPDGKIGTTIDTPVFRPYSDTEADRAATDVQDASWNRIFLDPLFKKRYPRLVMEKNGSLFPAIEADDHETIATPMDFFGLNYYMVWYVGADPSRPGGRRQGVSANAERSAMGWEIDPTGMVEALARMHRDYTKIPIYITENGFPELEEELAGKDPTDDGGRIHYIERHVRAVRSAMEQGIPVAGYFAWSLLDNFEWGYGYAHRFGIVRVDYETQERTPKKSARWYADLIARNGLP